MGIENGMGNAVDRCDEDNASLCDAECERFYVQERGMSKENALNESRNARAS
jgi:hypothetical protein